MLSAPFQLCSHFYRKVTGKYHTPFQHGLALLLRAAAGCHVARWDAAAALGAGHPCGGGGGGAGGARGGRGGGVQAAQRRPAGEGTAPVREVPHFLLRNVQSLAGVSCDTTCMNDSPRKPVLGQVHGLHGASGRTVAAPQGGLPAAMEPQGLTRSAVSLVCRR